MHDSALIQSICSILLKFQVTRHFRETLWHCILKLTERQHRQVPYCSPHNRRLQADLEIQDMLFQFGTIILSQLYIILYQYSTFDIPFNEEINRIYPRLLIGLAIEFVFVLLSTFFQLWLYNIAIWSIWSKYWLRHILANVIIMVVAISYFSPVLLIVFKYRAESSVNKKYPVRNCTTPFTY